MDLQILAVIAFFGLAGLICGVAAVLISRAVARRNRR